MGGGGASSVPKEPTLLKVHLTKLSVDSPKVEPGGQRQVGAGNFGIGDHVFTHDQLGHGAAHFDVVAGIGHVVDDDVSTERLGYRTFVAGRRIDHASDALRQAGRRVGVHPIARVDVL